jgi:hypothetical protein
MLGRLLFTIPMTLCLSSFDTVYHSSPARKGFSNSSASAGNARATTIRAERPTNFAAGMHFSFLLPSHFPYQQSGLKSRCFDVVPNAFVLTYKPLPTGSNDQATFWLGSKLLKTVWLMGALLLIAALNSAATASLKVGAISVLCFVLILAP